MTADEKKEEGVPTIENNNVGPTTPMSTSVGLHRRVAAENAEKAEEEENIEENKPHLTSPSKGEEPVKAPHTGPDTMESLIEEMGDRLLPFAEGEMVEAKVLAVAGNRIWVDVAGQSLGFIPEKEITSKTGLKLGDVVFATVISMEDEEGNVVLSMKRADREKYWLEMENAFKSGDAISVKISDANKGGLISDVGGILGFLPVSQLAPAHYPRVTGGDKDEILNRLRQYIGEEFNVKVITCEKETNKIIFSEKAVKAAEVKQKIDKFKVGDTVKGKITGIVDFGLFVSIDPEIEALVHISEISWTRVSDLHRLFKVGDEIETMVISVDDGRVSLSAKRLLPDPWVKAASKYKVGDKVSGEVTKITPFGAFVSLDPEIDGLVHISELSRERIVDPGQIVDLGKSYEFKIISIEIENHRLGLSMKVEQDKVKSEKLKVKSETKKPEVPETPKEEKIKVTAEKIEEKAEKVAPTTEDTSVGAPTESVGEKPKRVRKTVKKEKTKTVDEVMAE
ncbi:MAG: S1 RNA-binding domain-containing protein [bacterium]|nr:S1 RNA-binding domain-containing protein [bacterium]